MSDPKRSDLQGEYEDAVCPRVRAVIIAAEDKGDQPTVTVKQDEDHGPWVGGDGVTL